MRLRERLKDHHISTAAALSLAATHYIRAVEIAEALHFVREIGGWVLVKVWLIVRG